MFANPGYHVPLEPRSVIGERKKKLPVYFGVVGTQLIGIKSVPP
jgi:hypothetical protein